MKQSCLDLYGHQTVAGDGRSGKIGVIGHENFESCYLQVTAPDECKIEWKISTDVEFQMENGPRCSYDHVYLEWDSPSVDENGGDTFEHHQTVAFCNHKNNYTDNYLDWTATNHNVLTAHHKADGSIYDGQWEVDWRCSNGMFLFIILQYS